MVDIENMFKLADDGKIEFHDSKPEAQDAMRRNSLETRRQKFQRGDYNSQRLLKQREEKKNYLHEIYREDLAEWFSALFGKEYTPSELIADLKSGVVLCQLAGLIIQATTPEGWRYKVKGTQQEAFQAPKFTHSEQRFKTRDNIHNFIVWATRLGVPCVFETNDLSLQRNEGQVLNCLMDVARGARDSLDKLPTLVRFEQQHDDMQVSETPEEPINLEETIVIKKAPEPESNESQEEPVNLARDEKGRYLFRDQKLFVRCFNKHVVVRVGGGWDTLKHYLTQVVKIDVEVANEIIQNVVDDFESEKSKTKSGKSGKSGKKQDGPPEINNDFSLNVRTTTARSPTKGKTSNKPSHIPTTSKLAKKPTKVESSVVPRKKTKNGNVAPVLGDLDTNAVSAAYSNLTNETAPATEESNKKTENNTRSRTDAPLKTSKSTSKTTITKTTTKSTAVAPTEKVKSTPTSKAPTLTKYNNKENLQVQKPKSNNSPNKKEHNVDNSSSRLHDIRELIFLCGHAQTDTSLEKRVEVLVMIGYCIAELNVPSDQKAVLLRLAQKGNFNSLTRLLTRKRMEGDLADLEPTVTEL